MAQEQTLQTTVCIIGAGPAGIVLANILRRSHVDCLVIDAISRAEIFARGRAGVIESTTVDCLQRHDLAEPLIQHGRTNDRCEFRSPSGSVLFNYGALNNGEVHAIYPQNQLVDDLTQIYLDRGGQLYFNYVGQAIHQTDEHITVTCYDKTTQTPITIQADFAAGCDGQHGVARRAIPPEAVHIYHKHHPFNWLALLVSAPPSASHVIYALHPDGFAGHMPRTSTMSRFYLQIPSGDTVDDWPDARIWTALHTRLAAPGWHLQEGPIDGKGLVSLQSYVTEPMQYRRLFLLGDAAHLIPPCGGKGMNLAIHDADILAETLIRYYQNHLPLSALARYSTIRLPLIWRAQEFAYGMMQMVHPTPNVEPEEAHFLHKLKEAKLHQLETSPTFARDFARNYVGIR
jgi:p-hydroxybenzoate 3-monooxygenase